MMNIEQIYKLLQAINKYTLDMDEVSFGTLYCMIAEDYCKANQRDVRELMQEMTNMVNQVYEEEGAY